MRMCVSSRSADHLNCPVRAGGPVLGQGRVDARARGRRFRPASRYAERDDTPVRTHPEVAPYVARFYQAHHVMPPARLACLP